jgi:glycosyltransferase involved in cell wall biosynthesis
MTLPRASTVDAPGAAKTFSVPKRALPRVAMLQSSVGFDGRSRTLAFVVRMLNERGIRPVLFTFSDDADVERMKANASFTVQFDVVTVRRPLLAQGHQFEQLFLPRVAHKSLEGFDVVYASDTSVYGFDPGQVVVRLVCFPIEAVPRYEDRYRHPLYRAYGVLGAVATRIARRGFRPHGIWIANSQFTKQAMLDEYPLIEPDVHVVYPPVEIADNAAGPDREPVVLSLAGFHEDKRQLEQIELAAAIPAAQFVLIGSRRSRGYFRRCATAARNLPNVTLLPDASPDVIERHLRRAHVFLHSKRFEHFGMSTVEGIGHGCVPVVHDSGGQREVVPLPELRYATTADAIPVLERALAGEFDAHLQLLREHIESYSASLFRSRMAALIDRALVEAAS